MNNDPLTPFLATQSVVVLDGALSTELERRGADLNDPLWSAKLLVEDPALIRRVHYDYLRAGADVITTSSYQATFAGFARRGIDAAVAADLMRLSVTLALDARDEFWSDSDNRIGRLRPLVAASVGPYGAFLADGSEYRGDYDLDVAGLMEFHRPRMAVLAASGADLLACETIPCQAEGEALVRLLPEFTPMPTWLSYSCRDGERVSQGEPFATCVALTEGCASIVATGVNCTAPRHIEHLLAAAHAVTTRPLICYPNSGEAWDSYHHCWVDSPDGADFGAMAQRWYNAGARIIGGCCSTTPDDVREIVREIRE
ncbi:MAG: homocysteine S-methyltransferase [Anaerolineales bacterium]|nr:homocysteine S-methyltransferase [Anaerolineales bacterium]